MKTKLRRFTAVLSAMLCMICCVLSAVPAFADDTVTKNDLSSVKWSFVDSPLKIPHFQEVYDNFKSLISKTYNYIAVYGKKSDGTSETNILYFDPTAIAYYSFTNNQFLFGSNYEYDSQRLLFKFDSSDNKTESVGYGGWNVTKPSGFSKPECRALISLNDYVQSTVKVYFHTKVYDFDNIENELEPPDPNAPIVPFSVQYSPTLCKEMSNKIYYPSKGGANADSSGLVEDENYNLSVKVKLTDDFLKKTAVQNGYLEYSYQYTLFIVPSQFKDSDIKTMSDKAIYTAVNKSQFLYTGNERLDIDHSQTSEPATDIDTSKDVDNQWANANGITNCFYIPRDGSKSTTSTVNIDLHTVNWSKYDYDSYNIVVLSHVIRKTEYGWTAYPYYFTSDCEDLSKESKKEYPIKANADDPTKYDNVELYDYYTVVSDDFSLKDIPEYVQQTCDGTTIDQNSPLDFKNKADTVQDYELWKNGEKKNQDDFDDYKKQKQQAENFSNVNFGIDDISSIFNGTSSFYKFLTASISILPPYFLLILGAFFVTMLAICVVKWVLK
ncbi:hypothetical protein KQH97_01860 [Ruminococcus sp. MSJ-25]|uniref:hypothetical protein n=1 Tax=Ruminococcus sp. MSJ-25 TaxID=2841536 RepID=UPI001C103FCD|nr:hypothetical protein [Ruminococcus sp. MSJ-25]MBU5407038.1 hypothetical protein [Ruminococcus sp. MSJ-25]